MWGAKVAFLLTVVGVLVVYAQEAPPSPTAAAVPITTTEAVTEAAKKPLATNTLKKRSTRLQRARNRLMSRKRRFRNRDRRQRRRGTTPPPTTTPAGSTTTHMNEGVTTAITEDGVVLREPLKRSQVNRAMVAIRKLVNDNRTPAGHHPFNAGILRLSFHDCVGLLGCDGCINHNNRANSGVAFYARQLDKLWTEKFSHSMSQADFWALAGITVVQFSMELNPNCRGQGCVPDIPFFWGRHDCGVPTFFLHTFCPIHGDAASFFWQEFGLNKTDYTTLMGAHTLGRVNTVDGDTWDRTPDHFDSNYFVQLADKANKWKRANRTSVPELNESWTNVNGSLLMLGSDIALLSNISNIDACNPDPLNPDCPREQDTRDQVELFASDNKLFLAEFAKVYHRVVHKSPFRLQRVVEDTHFRPRWERLGTLPTFAPTTTTTTTTTTTPKPIVRGTALLNATPEFKGAKFCKFDGGVLCPFMEQLQTDNLDMEMVSGYQSPYGPTRAALGTHFLLQRGNLRTSGRVAWLKIKQFQAVTGCLHLMRYQAGTDSGRLTVYQALGGLYPGNEIKSTDSRNTTNSWTHEQYGLKRDDVAPHLSHELIIEFKMGIAGVIAIDDVVFDDRQDCS